MWVTIKQSWRILLCDLHASIMSIPYMVGFSPKRWQSVVGIMLEKTPGEFTTWESSHSLRVTLIMQTTYCSLDNWVSAWRTINYAPTCSMDLDWGTYAIVLFLINKSNMTSLWHHGIQLNSWKTTRLDATIGWSTPYFSFNFYTFRLFNYCSHIPWNHMATWHSLYKN
jgi:hypothetical protein